MGVLLWAVAFTLMCGFLGGSAVACVHIIESGKNMRMLEAERTKRTGMENAWQLEQAKLNMPELGTGSKPSEVTFNLAGSEHKWT